MPNRRNPAADGRGYGNRSDTGGDLRDRTDLPWELPHAFLGLDEIASSFETARAVILPIPYETTTSWGGGTRGGPAAIVEASRYLELYDQEFDREPAEVGIHTLPALELTREGPAPAAAEKPGAKSR